MKKQISCLFLCALIFLTGCAGRDPNPIALKMPGDADMSCNDLQTEMAKLRDDMKVLKPKTNKFWTNTLWLPISALMMDIKDAEKKEYNAMQRRYNHLLIIAKEKSCDFADSIEPVKAVK